MDSNPSTSNSDEKQKMKSKSIWYYSKDLRLMSVDELVEVIEDHQLYTDRIDMAEQTLKLIDSPNCTIEMARDILKNARIILGTEGNE